LGGWSGTRRIIRCGERGKSLTLVIRPSRTGQGERAHLFKTRGDKTFPPGGKRKIGEGVHITTQPPNVGKQKNLTPRPHPYFVEKGYEGVGFDIQGKLLGI